MSAPLVLTTLPPVEPKRRRAALKAHAAKPKAAKPRRPKAEPPATKVWVGARKRIAVSHLQMSLPGMGQLI
jgi:hypothetical protein